MDQMNEVFAAVLMGVTVYLAALARSFVKAKIDQYKQYMDEASRVRLEKAFDNIIDAAEAGAGNVQIQDVIGYVQQMNPGDLAQLKLRGAKLQERVATAIAARAARAAQDAVTRGVINAITRK